MPGACKNHGLVCNPLLWHFLVKLTYLCCHVSGNDQCLFLVMTKAGLWYVSVAFAVGILLFISYYLNFSREDDI